MSSAIMVENLGKKYLLRHQSRQESYLALRDVIADRCRSLGKRMLSPRSEPSAPHSPKVEEFWALKDVSFEVKQGDRVGIIGRNGAGKSTLLKILSRITEPTTGCARVKGRVASLLEVGTGFHPELTGRENIFLNGAILGMSRAEIKSKFDEIVAFAEIEKFLDTPVKRYSSGMYVRLAFAVGAHLEPEILVVDEVLAVGDLQFQRKCLGKMEEVATEGKTVLLVSHNMSSILSLSTSCILLSEGNFISQGAPPDIVSIYQQDLRVETVGRTDLSGCEHYGNGKARFRTIVLKPLDENREVLPVAITGCDLEFELRILAYSSVRDNTVALTIYDLSGNRLIDANTLVKGDSLTLNEGEEATVKFTLRNVRLKPGDYTAGLWLGVLNNADVDGIRYATTFRVEAIPQDILFATPFPGVYACHFEVEIGA